MTHKTVIAAPPLNDLGSGQDLESSGTQTREGVLLKRRRRRRLDLRTLPGALRESARVYRELAEGRISMAEAEVRSRVLRRHSEILSSVELGERAAAMDRRLEEILQLQQRSGRGGSVVDLLLTEQSPDEVPR